MEEIKRTIDEMTGKETVVSVDTGEAGGDQTVRVTATKSKDGEIKVEKVEFMPRRSKGIVPITSAPKPRLDGK